MPWYVSTLFIPQPLHFGDYGGMPLKIVWAVLDVLTIIILRHRHLFVGAAAKGRGQRRSRDRALLRHRKSALSS